MDGDRAGRTRDRDRLVLGGGPAGHQCRHEKKKVVGNFGNKGKEYRPKGDPVGVDVHDFSDPEVGKAIPFGVYDIDADEGFVVVGDDHDTAAFAVAVSVAVFRVERD